VFAKAIFFALLGAGFAASAHAVSRTYIAIAGSDSNVASNCSVSAPCREINAALTVTDAGGEILVLSSGSYQPATLNKSVGVVAAPGVHAGISVAAGTGIEIGSPGASVVLRGLSIAGVGGSIGISMTNGIRLAVEHCVISGFRSAGLSVSVPAFVSVSDSVLRDHGTGGARLSNGATAAIARSKFLGNGYGGIVIENAQPGTTTRASVSQSIVMGIKDGADWGISAESYGSTSTVQVEVTRSTITNTSKGVVAYSTSGGSATTVLTKSRVSGNTTGLEQLGGGAVLRSRGNNTVHGNSTNSSGAITPLPPV